MATKAQPDTTRRTPMQMLAAVAMAQAQRRIDPISSVEVNRSTTNGRYGFKVSVDHADPQVAFEKAMVIAANLRDEFPDEDAQAKTEKTTVYVRPKGKAA